ncbi:MAG: serine/threonine-protein kinase [Polyangiaceae bacterium]
MSTPSRSSDTGCPDEEQLLRFVDGEREERLVSHVLDCAACQQAIDLVVSKGGSKGASSHSVEDAVKWLEELRGRRASFLAPGAEVARYTVLRVVGEGGMGVVYAARDPELDRTVAIKLMHPRQEVTDRENRRLLREARALAKVTHPNVVAVYDVGTHDARVFVVMELVEGRTLREWLLEPHDRSTVLDAFVAAGRGLQAAHQAGLVHRDFKPDNVLIGDDGRARVTDFGLARAFRPAGGSRITASAAVVGTLSYMAPEVQEGGEADARSDQYSFAVSLHRAFAAKGSGQDVEAETALPRPIQKVLRRALAYDRDARYPSMQACLQALEEARRPSRRPVLALAAAAALLASAAILASRADQPEPAAPIPAVPTPEPDPVASSTTRAKALDPALSQTAPAASAAPGPPSASASPEPPPVPPTRPALPAPRPPADPLSEF